MEQESCFLTIVYRFLEPEMTVNNGLECINQNYEILRAVYRKVAQNGEKYSRLAVDFDVCSIQLAYVVYLLINRHTQNTVTETNVPVFAGVFETRELAEQFKNEINKEHRRYLDNKKFEKMDSIQVSEVLVAPY